MAAVAFDTHTHVKRLTSAGFTEAQAEAMTQLVTSAREADASGNATKADVATLEARISKAEADIIKWVAGMIGFQTIAVLGAVVALVRTLRP